MNVIPCHVDDGMIDPVSCFAFGDWIAIATGESPHDDETVLALAHPAQASIIVRALNNYDALVSALSEVLGDAVTREGPLVAEQRHADAFAALANAERKP